MADQHQHPNQKRQKKVNGGANKLSNTKTKKTTNNNMTTANNCNSRKSDVQLSKSLSWVLRHAAPSLGLKLAPDGFVPVEDVLTLNHPRFIRKDNHGRQPKYTVGDVTRVVENNDKQRFRLEYRDVVRTMDGNGNADSCGRSKKQIDAVKPCSLDQSTESNNNDIEEGTNINKVLCIRANQGHSLKGLQANQLLTPLTREELSHPNLSIIHGTTRKSWEDHIQHEGLSRRKRNHIHFATGLPPSAAEKTQKYENKQNSSTPISGMRSSSEIYIYINGSRCANDGIPFYRSDNDVILTAGVKEKEGVLPVKYFEKVVDAFSGTVLWGQDE